MGIGVLRVIQGWMRRGGVVRSRRAGLPSAMAFACLWDFGRIPSATKSDNILRDQYQKNRYLLLVHITITK